MPLSIGPVSYCFRDMASYS